MKIAEQAFEDPVLGLVFQFKTAPDGRALMFVTGMGERDYAVADMIRSNGLTRDYSFGEDGQMDGAGTFLKPATGPIDGS